MVEIEVPEGWSEIDVEDETQLLRGFQRRSDGLVLTVEEYTTDKRYSSAFLPENFQQDNQPIRQYGDGGYLKSSDSLEEVKEAVQEWMENNKRD